MSAADTLTREAGLGTTHLDAIESEAIHILREAAAEFRNPTLLFSGGKDSAVLLRLAEKAFRPDPLPLTLLNIETGHDFPEALDFRDATAARVGAPIVVRRVEDTLVSGRARLKSPNQSRNALQSVTLLDAIAEFAFDSCLGGARRDEERSRAKERVFSFRNSFGQWDPRRQRPELWSLYNTRVDAGEHMRVFPLSNWTELDVWRYIARERVALPSLYFAHERPVVRRGQTLLAASTLVEPRPGDHIETMRVRFRTVGDMSCTLPIPSDAATAEEVIAETAAALLSERGASRLDDRASDTAMEDRKRAGYF